MKAATLLLNLSSEGPGSSHRVGFLASGSLQQSRLPGLLAQWHGNLFPGYSGGDRSGLYLIPYYPPTL